MPTSQPKTVHADAKVLSHVPRTRDAIIGDAAFWRSTELVYPKPGKRRITLHLDTDVPDWFKAGGKGYQTRINAVLRAFMRARRAGKPLAFSTPISAQEM